jgi:ABC-type transporter Mla subunit MlaD
VSRRRLGLLAGVAATAGLALAGCGSGSGEGGSGATTRIDAIFDNASFVSNGQDVRVAGAKVGTVSDVQLTRDRKARLTLEVQERFTPFRADASCTILPQSLIGEKFVECDPGTPSAPALRRTGGQPAPTLSLRNTSSPVDLDLVVAMLGQPTNVRFQLLTNEFGAGLASRGPQLSEAIRRANPALTYIRRTLDVVGSDKAALQRVLTATDEILGELDRQQDQLTGTFDESARFLKISADYRAQLDRTIRELPPTLQSLRPALQALRDLTRDATPTLASLRRASPSLRQLAGDLKPLSDAARPALTRLARASRVGAPILRRAAPQLQRLSTALQALAPNVPILTELNQSLRDTGAPEFLSRFLFTVAMSTARFDGVSHILPAHVNFSSCLFVTETYDSHCSAKFLDERGGRTSAPTSTARLAQRPGVGRDAQDDAPAARSAARSATTPPSRPTATTPAPATGDAGAAARSAAALGGGR